MPPIAVDQLIGNPNVTLFSPNANVQTRLENNYAQDYLAFRLTGTATLAGYTAAPAKFIESLENLLAILQLTATGKSSGATTDTLCSVDAAFLRFKTRLMEGTDVTRYDIGTANGTYNFETNFKRYFCDPRSNRSGLTRLFTNLLSTLTASFQFRDQTALVYGGTAGAVTLSGVQVTVQSRMYLGLNPPNPSPYVKETQRTFNITQQQNLRRFDRVPVNSVLRRQFFKGMLGPTNYADPSDSMFAATGKPEGPHVQLVLNDQTTKLDQVYQQLRQDNKAMFEQESMPAGYCVFEPARTGRLTDSIPTGNVDHADNYFDVNYTAGSINTIQITDEQMIKLSASQWSAAA